MLSFSISESVRFDPNRGRVNWAKSHVEAIIYNQVNHVFDFRYHNNM